MIPFKKVIDTLLADLSNPNDLLQLVFVRGHPLPVVVRCVLTI